MRKVWVAAVAALACFVGPATAQPQPRDPFNGRFGVVETAHSPAESARRATLVGEALEAVAPQRPGTLDVYVISAALWGDPVFEREASQSAEILRDHFGAE